MVHRRETGQSVAYRAVSAKRRNAVLLPARGIYTLAYTAKCVPDTYDDSEKAPIRRTPNAPRHLSAPRVAGRGTCSLTENRSAKEPDRSTPWCFYQLIRGRETEVLPEG